MLRLLSGLSLVAAVMLTPAASGGPDVVKLVDVTFQDEPLRYAAERLFKENNLRFRVEPNVPNVPISVRLAGVRPEAAANVLLRIGRTMVPNLELVQSEGTWVLRVGTAALADPPYEPEKDPRLAGKITAEAGPTLRAAFAAVFAKTGIPYVVLPSAPDIPLKVSIRDRSLRDALAEVMQQAHVQAPDLYLGIEYGVVLIGLRSRGPATPAGLGKSSLPGPNRKAA